MYFPTKHRAFFFQTGASYPVINDFVPTQTGNRTQIIMSSTFQKFRHFLVPNSSKVFSQSIRALPLHRMVARPTFLSPWTHCTTKENCGHFSVLFILNDQLQLLLDRDNICFRYKQKNPLIEYNHSFRSQKGLDLLFVIFVSQLLSFILCISLLHCEYENCLYTFYLA